MRGHVRGGEGHRGACGSQLFVIDVNKAGGNGDGGLGVGQGRDASRVGIKDAAHAAVAHGDIAGGADISGCVPRILGGDSVLVAGSPGDGGRACGDSELDGAASASGDCNRLASAVI